MRSQYGYLLVYDFSADAFVGKDFQEKAVWLLAVD